MVGVPICHQFSFFLLVEKPLLIDRGSLRSRARRRQTSVGQGRGSGKISGRPGFFRSRFRRRATSSFRAGIERLGGTRFRGARERALSNKTEAGAGKEARRDPRVLGVEPIPAREAMLAWSRSG